MKTTIMRLLRQRHDISLREMADASQLSVQYISMIELGAYPATKNAKAQIAETFDSVVKKRLEVLQDLIVDCERYRDNLLDLVDPNDLEGL